MDLKKLSPMQQKQIEAADEAIANLQNKKALVEALPAHLNYKTIDLRVDLPLRLKIVVDDADSVLYLLGKFKPIWLDHYDRLATSGKELYQVACETYKFREVYFTWQSKFKHVGIYLSTTQVELTQEDVIKINEQYRLKPGRGAKFGLYNWQQLRKTGAPKPGE